MKCPPGLPKSIATVALCKPRAALGDKISISELCNKQLGDYQISYYCWFWLYLVSSVFRATSVKGRAEFVGHTGHQATRFFKMMLHQNPGVIQGRLILKYIISGVPSKSSPLSIRHLVFFLLEITKINYYWNYSRMACCNIRVSGQHLISMTE